MTAPNAPHDRVVARAKEIVQPAPTQFGYVDVGDIIVSYLREDISEDAALQQLEGLQKFYEEERR